MGCCRRAHRVREVDTLPRWIRLLRKLHRVRRLQRLFAVIGQHLQGLPWTLRHRVQRALPKSPRRR